VTNAIPTVDGGFLFSGINMTEIMENDDFSLNVQAEIIKIDGQGNLQWTKSFDSEGYTIVFDVIQTRDGGYALVGGISDAELENMQMCLIKTAVNGEVGLAMTSLTENTVTLYRGESDPYWNYVRVRIWVIK
jgi:hypothetical protein